jgi:hypothetical protein
MRGLPAGSNPFGGGHVSTRPLAKVHDGREDRSAMAWWELVIVFTCLWVGFTLVIDGVSRGRSRRPNLAERLMPYSHPTTLADEAEGWLRSRLER